tara:strand:+ start:544 stop:4146 length:3603 start_codon:yes stop_codon:yes gene_type:complete
MATWKKVIVSGSNISQLNNDSGYLASAGGGILSGSTQIAANISGSSTALSSSAAGRITTLETSTTLSDGEVTALMAATGSNYAHITNLNTFTGSAARRTAITGSSTALSSSLAGRVTANEVFSASLDATFATEAEVLTISASVKTFATAADTTLSASVASDIATNLATATATDGEVTNLMASTGSIYAHVANLNTFTGSAGRKSAISGSSTALSASIASDIASISTTFNVGADSGADDAVNSGETLNFTGAGPIATTVSNNTITIDVTDAIISGSSTALSSSIAGRVTTEENNVDLLQSHQTNLLTYTGSAARKSAISGSTTALSASIASDVATNKNTATATDGEVTNLMAATGSQYAHIASINAFTASAGRRSAISGSFTTVSGSIAGRLTTVEGTTTNDLLSSSAQIAADISGSSRALSSSIAGRATTNETEIDALQAFSQSVDAALDFSGANVTVTGNLTVSGTTTNVDSTTLDIGDNIIALNGTGATKGGLAVNDANGPASGSLLWDGTNNYWVAGATGSEVQIALRDGHGILSSSAQIATNISGSQTALSSSIATRVTTNEVNDAKLDAEVTSLMGATGSAYAHIANLNTFTGSAGRKSAISGSFTTISSSLASRITTTNTTATALDGEVTNLMAATGSQFAHITNLNAFTGSAARKTAISGSTTALSASIASDIADIETSFTLAADSGANDTFNSSETLTFAGAGPITTTVSNNQISIDVTDAIISGSSTALSSSIATRLATIEAVDSATDGEVVALMAATGSQYAHIASLNTKTGSLDTEVTALEAFSSSLSSTVISYTGSFTGDGSNLTDISVSQTATVESTFTSATTASVTHNFGSRNVIVSVYEDGSNEQIIPSTVRLSSLNAIEVHFGSSTSGKVIVAQGGHIVSGSVPFANISSLPTLISGSAQIATNISGSSTALSASIASDIASISTTFTIDGDSGTSNALDSGETLTIGGAGPITTTVSTNAITIDVTDSVISGSSTALSASVASDVATNLASVGTLTSGKADKTAVSGAFTATSASIASDIAGISTSFTIAADAGSNDTFNSSETLTFAGTANEVNTTVSNNQIQIGLPDDVTIGGALTVTGDLTVTGTTTEQQVTNLNVEDQFILLNSGSAAQDAGFVINGQGAALGWDESENRFALDFTGATWNQTSITSDAFVAAVVTSDDANYQKVGNIRIDGDDIYIYS